MNSDRSDSTPSFEQDFCSLIRGLTVETAPKTVDSMNYFYQNNCGPWFYQKDRRDSMIWLVRHIQSAFRDNIHTNERCKSFFHTVEICESSWIRPSDPHYRHLVYSALVGILGPELDFSFSKLYLENKNPELCLDKLFVC